MERTEPALAAFNRRRLMVMCAPNGARRSQADHPALPISPAELADEAEQLLCAGVSVLHLHVRDEHGQHTLSVEAYRAAIDAIRERVGRQLVLQVTTEAVGRYTPDQQMEMVRRLRPEAVSLALRELMPSEPHEKDALAFFNRLSEEGIWQQFIVYSPQELARLEHLRQSGALREAAPSVLLVLGSYLESRPGSTRELDGFLHQVDLSRFSWAACCFGQSERALMLKVAELGGHVRLGFENNLALPDGSVAPSNSELVSGFLSALEHSERQAATAEDVRRVFNIP